jgi:hypothetical protein
MRAVTSLTEFLKLRLTVACGLVALAALGGCASEPQVPLAPAPPALVPVPPKPEPPAPATSPHYRCESNLEFSVRFADDSALLDMGPRGNETLLRDAGGVTPQQTVYSNARLRAEFGLGAQGREAILRYIASPQVVRCTRD